MGLGFEGQKGDKGGKGERGPPGESNDDGFGRTPGEVVGPMGEAGAKGDKVSLLNLKFFNQNSNQFL